MRTYNVTVSPLSFDHKPDDSELATIQSSFIYSGMTYNQLIEYSAQPYSYTIAPAVYKNNYRNAANWQSQDVYYLDFDGTIPIDDVLNRFKDYDITPNFYYTTFGHTETTPRYRVVLLTDSVVDDPIDGNKIRNGLRKVFPEADGSCFGADKMFFGGKNSFPITDEPIPFAKLDQMISLHVLEADNGKSRGLVSDRVSLCNYNSYTHSEPIESESYRTYLEGLKDNKFDFDELFNKVRIFREFEQGEWLYHHQLFGIATNLKWLKGGARRFNSILEKHNKSGATHYSKQKFRMMTYLANRKYFPMSLKSFSPYPEDWKYLNLITAVKMPIRMIEPIRRQEWITLAAGTEVFNREIERVLTACDNKIYIFKVPTGFGKTNYLTHLNGQVIAFPTHDLKDEVSLKMHVEHTTTPELPVFGGIELSKRIKAYYDMGLNEAVRKVLLAVATNSEDIRTMPGDAKLAKDYLDKINMKAAADVTLLTTHQRALLTDTLNSSIIFDEDPIKDILNISTVSLSDLALINSMLPKDNRFDSTIELIHNTAAGTVTPLRIGNIDRNVLCETLAKNQIKTNVVDFVRSLAFIKTDWDNNKVYYITKRDLPDDKKVIIMSASAQTHLYERLYPERVEVIDLSNIELMGSVYQHTDLSYSRSSLTEINVQDIRDEIGFIPVITFKNKKDRFNHIKLDMHHGNVGGYDELNGSDIAVVGTPHYNDIVYRLFAFAVGIDPNGEGELKKRLVDYGNYRFSFMTFSDPDMQKIQLGLIESDLIQAVGRARTLRNDCVVELYSNLPLSFSQLANAA